MGFGASKSFIKLDLILPLSLRGLTYDAVRASKAIPQFFDLANMVLISREAMATYIKSLDMSGVTKDKPLKTHLPPVDLDYLRLRDENGNLIPDRVEAAFSIVAAYWEGRGKLGTEAGLVAGLWRRGISAPDIIRCIEASTGPNGKLIKASGRGHDIMHTVIEAYLASHDLSPETELPQTEMTALIDRWLTATRSASLGTKDSQNTVLHWADYRRLGLIDESGAAQLDQVRLIAQKVFAINGQLSFEALLSWVEKYHARKLPEISATAKAARAKLQQKRKQGKLNRKRGP